MRRTRLILGLTFLAVLIPLAWAAAAGRLTPKEQLGKSIFFDKNLSLKRNQACAACHAPDVGWSGAKENFNLHGSVYEGSIPGRFGERKPPTSAYAASSPVLHDEEEAWVGGHFWDGRATGNKLGNPAADQAQGPFLNPAEQALPDSACVVYLVCRAEYPVSFEAVWGEEACDIGWPADVEAACATEGGQVVLSPEDRAKANLDFDKIALAIAAFEASHEVNPFTSQFDSSLKAGRKVLSKQARKGFTLFKGKGKCGECHVSDGDRPLFTDFTYDNLGIPRNPENPATIKDPAFIDLGLGAFLRSAGNPAKVWELEIGKHKVPTLRNVAKAPSPGFVKAYGHNGYFKSLKGIVHFYNTRDVKPACPGHYTEAQALAEKCWPVPEVAQNLNKEELGNLRLTPAEEDAIVEFLKTLSD